MESGRWIEDYNLLRPIHVSPHLDQFLVHRIIHESSQERQS